MAYETGSTEAGRPAGLSDDNPRLRDSLDEEAESFGERGSPELGEDARARAERLRVSAAHGLDTAADAMHSGGERVASAAHRAGDALSSSAEYVRVNDVGDMVDDVMDLMRNNPGPALLCAAAFGFVLGRAVYRR
jgi:ElaB/YqjD/DUF883 family membrane-anchored ribosome-binding protein